MKNRQLPNGVGVKTGTLDRVSALAGVIPLNNGDRVWFAAINNGGQVELFRQQQDQLLQKLVSIWNSRSDFPRRYPPRIQVYLGDPQRNQINNNYKYN
jgi:D-alanyl-D-alanine carboxypeptidase/D-alanyl-D-alanine-endopeptidase (penicillin-binding protein 4)